MPRPPNEKCAEAEKLYHKGVKLVDIGTKLGVPASTVRRWKHDKGWDKSKKKQSERSEQSSTNARFKNKGGAPKGNKNAVGHKNTNPPPDATKHGAYSRVYWDTLDETEWEMIQGIPKDEELLLIEQIQLFAVRERRIMKAINKYRNVKGDVAVESVFRTENKRAFRNEQEEELYNERINEKVAKKERLPGREYKLETSTTNKDTIVARLEKELSTVQSKKTKAIESLGKIRTERAKLNGDSSDDVEVQIYLPDNGRNAK